MSDVSQDDTPEAIDYMMEIETLSVLVAEARELVGDGNLIDMSRFQERVAVLCGALAEQPPANAEEVTAAIQDLVGDLNALAQELQAATQDAAK